MRIALVGIAAALVLTTLVIAIVPAFAFQSYFFFTSDYKYGLLVDPLNRMFYLFIAPGGPMHLCDGLGATVKGGLLTIFGRCTNIAYPSLYAGKGVLSGVGKLTGPVVVILAVAGKPPIFMRFIMWPT